MSVFDYMNLESCAIHSYMLIVYYHSVYILYIYQNIHYVTVAYRSVVSYVSLVCLVQQQFCMHVQ